MKLYAISGLGADKRVFDYLTLDSEIVHLDWVEPKKKENIEDYAMRLAQNIDKSEPFGIIGVSFGGMIAVEISKVLKPKVTILISSAETKEELKGIYKGFGKTKMITLLPEKAFDIPRRIAKYIFGTNNTKLLNKILDDTDLKFVKWAVNALITWKNETRIENSLKINGTKDKLIKPSKKDKNIKWIEGGEHFMVVDKGGEISRLIKIELDKIDRFADR